MARTTIQPLAYPLPADEMVPFCGLDQIDPMSVDDYVAKGGGDESLKKAVTSMSQVDVINELKTANILVVGGPAFRQA